MKVNVSQNGLVELTEVFNPIELNTGSGENLKICMRDSGFEFTYEGEVYHAKGGIVKKIDKQSMPSPDIADDAMANAPGNN